MSGHGANPVFFNKIAKTGRPEHLLAPSPLPPLCLSVNNFRAFNKNERRRRKKGVFQLVN